MKLSGFKSILILGLMLVMTNAFSQDEEDDFNKQNLEVFSPIEQKRYEDVPDDPEDIKPNIKVLERYKKSEKRSFTLFDEYLASYRSIAPSSASQISEEIARIKALIQKFEKKSSEVNYNILQEQSGYFLKYVAPGGLYTTSMRRTPYYFKDSPELKTFIDNLKYKKDSIEERCNLPASPVDISYSDYYDLDTIVKSNFDLNSAKEKVSQIKEYIDKLETCIKKGLFTSYEALDQSSKQTLERKKSEISARLAKIDELIKKHKTRSKELNKDINEWGIQQGLPWYCGTVVALFLITVFSRRVLQGNRGYEGPTGKGDQEHLSTVLLEVITVLLLTLTILILGLSNILKENVLGTLIGGIAAYILNRASNMKKAGSGATNKINKTQQQPENN